MKKVVRPLYNIFLDLKRSFKLSLLQVKNNNLTIGSNTIIDYKTKIYSFNNTISIGNNVYLRSNDKYYQAGMPFSTTLLTDVKGSFIKIGDNCRINGVYIHAQKGITIGANCVIASGVNIMDSNGHQLKSYDRTSGRDEPSEIVIGNNVWIGLNAIILKGTIIGNNAVIGAGSVVKGEYPANSLIMGNPAKLVKQINMEQ